MRAPCAANLDTARELLDHGVVDEGAQKLVELRRCAQDCGCEDWQNCTHTIEGTWLEAAEPRPADADKGRGTSAQRKSRSDDTA
jgi:hypothetical protein